MASGIFGATSKTDITISPMNSERIYIPARDDYLLSGHLYLPSSTSKGFVQIHCGTGIPQKVYSNLAKYLAENDYTTLTFDYRGIAESAPRSIKNNKAKISDWGTLDMTGVLDWAEVNFPNTKKMVVGHSMGAQMVGLMDNHEKIDQLFFIAASTGYWLDMNHPFKWLSAFYWYFLIPMHIHYFGFVNAKKIRQGENLPKDMALEWRNWCTQPDYFINDFRKSKRKLFFNEITTPIKAIHILDDPIANITTTHKFLKYFKQAKVDVKTINPLKYGINKIGHTGFFSRKFQGSLWAELKDEMDSVVA